MAVSAKEMYALTKKRLEGYELFSKETIETVARFAKKQAEYTTYEDFFKAYAIPTPKLYVSNSGAGVPVVDIAARSKEKGIIVVHLPMSNPLDANQLYQVATIVGINPAHRVIAFGNPSGTPFFYKEQNLTIRKRIGIATLRNLRPLVEAELDYLEKHNATNVHHVGYSFGAHKALIEASYMKTEQVSSVVLVDPVAHPRGIRQLLNDFKRTLAPLDTYVKRTNLDSFFKARQQAAKTNHFNRALRRPINIAIGYMLARFDFVKSLQAVLEQKSHLKATVAWGSKSELGNDAYLSTSLAQLARENPGRIKKFRLQDDRHALANDVHLHAALILDSLLDPQPSTGVIVKRTIK